MTDRQLFSAKITRQVTDAAGELRSKDALDDLARQLEFSEAYTEKQPADFQEQVIATFSRMYCHFRDKLIEGIQNSRDNQQYSFTFRDLDGGHVEVNPRNSEEEQREQLIYLTARKKVFIILQTELSIAEYNVHPLKNEEGLEHPTGFQVSW